MRLLNIFLKEPLPGQVKTRLAADLGDEQAAVVYRAMVRTLLQQLSGLEETDVRFYFAPDDADEAIRFWILPEILEAPEILLDPARITFHPQSGGDLGERLRSAAGAAHADGYDRVAYIGSDCIEISSRWIHAAFAQLSDRYQMVIGPTPDGGYHLLATSGYYPELFEDIPWSSPATYESTLARAAQRDLAVFALPPLPDIDTHDDYQAALNGPLGARLRNHVKQIEENS